jgi:type VI secretion system protein ImpH
MERMATYGWRDRRSVEDALFTEGHRFSFVQAVRLLEEMHLRPGRTAPAEMHPRPGRTAPAEGTDPEREIVHFRHAVRMDFPPTDVEEIQKPKSGEGPVEMTVNVLGLAGVLGPLPPAVSELIVERAFRKDTAFRDFLDIFNHRLVSLLYRARKKYRPALDPNGPDRGRVASVLQAFLGLAMPQLRGRMCMPDRALLPYTGLLLDRHRSAAGLRAMLQDYFEIAVAVVPFQGEWNAIEEDDRTYIGRRTGRNHVLGHSAVLGRRIWDEEANVEIHLGPLTFTKFLSFLPAGQAHHAIGSAVRFYLRGETGFAFRLQLVAAEVPPLHIGAGKKAYLGWTTWLRHPDRPFSSDDTQVRLRSVHEQ